ncbi:hypothetical protein BJ508DRAFT_327446 [Ascobolus immersus RN42]|uniref:Uncharacterized protein n=1 Tax=Ascobolus immersus RN42 TaxID=1160509 RepID=A0A3N4I830_ASCIM|nr:hypothetical protein BJ508DRAFT_327446 [Ascobolus immersus RN42]
MPINKANPVLIQPLLLPLVPLPPVPPDRNDDTTTAPTRQTNPPPPAPQPLTYNPPGHPSYSACPKVQELFKELRDHSYPKDIIEKARTIVQSSEAYSPIDLSFFAAAFRDLGRGAQSRPISSDDDEESWREDQKAVASVLNGISYCWSLEQQFNLRLFGKQPPPGFVEALLKRSAATKQKPRSTKATKTSVVKGPKVSKANVTRRPRKGRKSKVDVGVRVDEIGNGTLGVVLGEEKKEDTEGKEGVVGVEEAALTGLDDEDNARQPEITAELDIVPARPFTTTAKEFGSTAHRTDKPPGPGAPIDASAQLNPKISTKVNTKINNRINTKINTKLSFNPNMNLNNKLYTTLDINLDTNHTSILTSNLLKPLRSTLPKTLFSSHSSSLSSNIHSNRRRHHPFATDLRPIPIIASNHHRKSPDRHPPQGPQNYRKLRCHSTTDLAYYSAAFRILLIDASPAPPEHEAEVFRREDDDLTTDLLNDLTYAWGQAQTKNLMGLRAKEQVVDNHGIENNLAALSQRRKRKNSAIGALSDGGKAVPILTKRSRALEEPSKPASRARKRDIKTKHSRLNIDQD